MFENLIKRGIELAERRVRERAGELAERLRTELPKGIEAEPAEGGVRLSGRELAMRLVLEAGLRFLLARIR